MKSSSARSHIGGHTSMYIIHTTRPALSPIYLANFTGLPIYMKFLHYVPLLDSLCNNSFSANLEKYMMKHSHIVPLQLSNSSSESQESHTLLWWQRWWLKYGSISNNNNYRLENIPKYTILSSHLMSFLLPHPPNTPSLTQFRGQPASTHYVYSPSCTILQAYILSSPTHHTPISCLLPLFTPATSLHPTTRTSLLYSSVTPPPAHWWTRIRNLLARVKHFNANNVGGHRTKWAFSLAMKFHPHSIVKTEKIVTMQRRRGIYRYDL